MPWPLIGNERAVKVLKSAVANRAVQHAYLFIGPERLGRATLARMLAQAVNCTGDAPPCGECGQCSRIKRGIHPDVQTVSVEHDPDSPAKKSISIEQLRDVQQAVSLAPYEGRTRLVVIDPADLMLGAAQAAFLKTLEEPPPNVVFVLIASNEDVLEETIRSRCARVEFNYVPTAEIEAALVSRGASLDDARLLARLSEGHPGWAIAAAGEPGTLERRQETLNTARSLVVLPLSKRMDLAEKLVESFRKDREPVLRTLTEWQGWWRDVLLVQSASEDSVANIDMLDALREDASQTARSDVYRFLRSLGDAREALQLNVQTKITLEALMLDAPRARTATG